MNLTSGTLFFPLSCNALKIWLWNGPNTYLFNLPAQLEDAEDVMSYLKKSSFGESLNIISPPLPQTVLLNINSLGFALPSPVAAM